jgi:hypothetical protein
MSAGATASDFVSALFSGDDGFVELRALPSKSRTFLRPSVRRQLELFVAAHTSENVYIGVAMRRRPGDGSGENCASLGALFVDLDYKRTPETDARAALARFALKPSIVVASGGGLHAYWLLREPIDLHGRRRLPSPAMCPARCASFFSTRLRNKNPAKASKQPGHCALGTRAVVTR